jgi:glycine betaine/proline transport system substrate-binding protein
MKTTLKHLTTTAVFAAIATPALAQDIVIGLPNWPSGSATAHVLKVAIETNLGLEVELQNGTNPIFFEGMDSGSVHVHPEVWLPNQQNLHDTFVTEKGSVVMNPNSGTSFQGMCVDTATASAHGIEAIEDLTNPEVAALFDTDGDGLGELWGGATGWAATSIERIRAKSYGYDQTFELQELDDTVAFGNLANAISAGKPWAGFCYTPHYIFSLHDMTVLKEPEHDPAQWNITQPNESPNWLEISSAPVAWDVANFHIHYAKILEQNHPNVAKLLNNASFDVDTVSGFTYALSVEKMDPMDFASKWVLEHEDEVLGWLTN